MPTRNFYASLILATATAAVLCAAAARAQTFVPVAPTPTTFPPAIDQAYDQLMKAPAVRSVMDAVKADHERSVQDMRALTEIEAPPFKEQAKARAFLARL